MAREFWVRDGSGWRKASKIWVRDASNWREAQKVYVHDGSAWRQVYQKFQPQFTYGCSAEMYLDSSEFDYLGGTLWVDTDGGIRIQFVHHNWWPGDGWAETIYNLDWGTPHTSGIGSNYYVKVTRTGGVWNYADADNYYVSLASTRQWSVGAVYDYIDGQLRVDFHISISTTADDSGIVAQALNQYIWIEMY